MSKSKIAVLIVCALLAVSISAASAQSEGQSNTSIIVQNLSTSAADIVAVFYPETGAPASGSKGVADLAGESSTTFDQRYESGDPGQSPFRGSVVLYSDQPVGSVVQVVTTGGSGGVNSYDAYGTPVVSDTVIAPLILRGISSAGKVFNTYMAIQNTSAGSTDVTVTFTPTTMGSADTVNLTIAESGSAYLMQKDQTALGTQFFGSARVEATTPDHEVAVVVVSTATDGSIFITYPTYAGGSTWISLPGAMKNVASIGDNYFTSLTIVNLGGSGDPDPTVQIEYLPKTGTATGPYTVTVSTAETIDQRYDTHITSDSFFGAVELTSTNGTPVAAVLNSRGDAPGGAAKFATTYGGFASGVQTAYVPYLLKYINSAGYSWSTSILLQNLDPASGDLEVDVLYKEDPSRGTNTYTSHQTIASFDWVDLRYDTNLAQATFYGGAKIVSTNARPFGAVVLVRGSGFTGDALSAYLGIAPPPSP